MTQKLLENLERKEAALRQAELDLESEKEARRRLQGDTTLIKEEAGLWKKRPFVVLLIDADADAYVVSIWCLGQIIDTHADPQQISSRTDSLRTVRMVVLLQPMRCSARCSDLLSSTLKIAPVGLTYS